MIARRRRSGRNRLVALHIPFDTADNPYQALLARSLERYGIVIVGARRGRRLILGEALSTKADVVHFHWPETLWLGGHPVWSLAKLAALCAQLLVLRAAGVRVFWTAHNLSSHDSSHPRIETQGNRILARIVDGIVVHGPSAERVVRRELALRDDLPVVSAWHGSFRSWYPAVGDETRTDVRRSLCLGGDADVILLHLGQLRRYKGLFELVATLRATRPHGVRLVIAGRPGDPELSEELTLAIGEDADMIDFRPGRVSDRDVPRYLLGCDVVVLPYRNILTSGSVVLAMSFERACAVPASGCIPDYADASSAFLYDPDDPSGLRGALQRVIGDRAGARDRGMVAGRRAAALSWDDMAKKLASLYRATDHAI